MIDPERRSTGLPDWMAVALAVGGFLLFIYIGRHYYDSGIFARLLGP